MKLLQRLAADWVVRCFGDGALDSKERARRVLEEAIELAQAEGVAPEFVHHLTTQVYLRPPGEPFQEAGGVAFCLLAYCESVQVLLDDVLGEELQRVLSREPGHFRRRQADKARAGLGRMPSDE